MRKFLLLFIVFAFAATTFSQENSWDVSPIKSDKTEKPVQQADDQPADTSQSKHNLSVEYGLFNFTDFLGAISSALSNKSMYLVGDISVNYGYETGNVFETGLIFNIAVPFRDYPFVTIMPRAKLNFNHGGYVNAFMELDAGIITQVDGSVVTPMVHATLFGLEIGHFYMQLLGWGQRGLWYAGIKIPL